MQNHLIRSHKIKLTDILAYLYRRECRQEADSPYICAMRTFYDEHLSPYSDLLSVKDIQQITGFSSSAIVRWISTGILKAFQPGKQYTVPKDFMLDFLISPYYRLPCLGKLHIGGVCAAVHKLGNTHGGVLPCDHLRAAHIFRASAGGDVDAVYGIPRGKLALRGFEAVAAVEGALQQRGNVLHRLLLLERGGNDHAGVVRVAAQPQHMVKLRLRNGKSEGRLCALRFFYSCNLFRFGGEKG